MIISKDRWSWLILQGLYVCVGAWGRGHVANPSVQPLLEYQPSLSGAFEKLMVEWDGYLL